MTSTVQTPGPDWGGILRKLAWGGAIFLLALPAVAMRFTSEVNWDGFDFLVMGVLLFGCAALVDLTTRRTRNLAHLGGVVIAVGTSFLLIWINLAVGIIGNEDNPANLLFAGVIGIAVVGAAVARFRPKGLSNAMLAAGAAQGAIGLFAFALGWAASEPPGAARLLILNLVFVGFWLGSAALFRLAA